MSYRTRHRPYADPDTQRRQGLPTTGALTPPTAVCHHDWGNGGGHCESWPCADATAVLMVHQIQLEAHA